MGIKAVPSSRRVPDIRVFNKADIAAAFEVSLPTVNLWIKNGCTVLQKGSKGIAWELDIFEVFRWRFKLSRTDDEVSPEEMLPKDRLI
jgi:phage terminase Nu1 subunit (DNA packaging protein)